MEVGFSGWGNPTISSRISVTTNNNYYFFLRESKTTKKVQLQPTYMGTGGHPLAAGLRSQPVTWKTRSSETSGKDGWTSEVRTWKQHSKKQIVYCKFISVWQANLFNLQSAEYSNNTKLVFLTFFCGAFHKMKKKYSLNDHTDDEFVILTALSISEWSYHTFYSLWEMQQLCL